ncbi:MAG: cupin domain-containing protein [Phycisphaeraceae bacterium]|nr:cupin domain-containing protein [Phycisphaeraceae bacterium]
MLIRRPEQVEPQPMTMPGAMGVAMRLMIGRTDGAPTFAMRLFEVAVNGHTPLHQHNYEHEVIVLEGEGLVTGGVGGHTIRPIKPGDVVYMPANEIHQFRNTGQQPLRFYCLIPTTFDCGKACQPTPGS